MADHAPPSVVKTLKRLPRAQRERLLDAIAELPAGDVRPLRAFLASGGCELTSGGCVFRRDDDVRTVDIVLVAARGSATCRELSYGAAQTPR